MVRSSTHAVAGITIAAAFRAADAVMWQVLFVAVDANQILERTGNARFSVRL